jgi:hypothetical protein
MSTFAELKTDVIFNAFSGPKYLERAGGFINRAARDLARRSLWAPTRVTLPVAADGSAPTGTPGLARITAVWSTDTTGRVIDRYRFAGDPGLPGAQATAPLDDRLDEPTYTTELGNAGATVVRVIPVPAAALITVTGNRLPSPLDGDGDVCELGDDADDALVLFARAKLYLREDDPEMHAALMAEYENEARRFRLTARPVLDGPLVTPGTWGDGSFGGV